MVDHPQSRKLRISAELTRIIRGYVILITALMALVLLLFGYYFKLSQLVHQRDLVGTKLSAEVDNVARELHSLASSTLVWTGLTDSFGRDSYLEPLLSRFNRDTARQFVILDYRGRVFLAQNSGWGAAVAAGPVVQQAVARGDDAHGMATTAEGQLAFVLVHPVMSPQSQSPVGFIVGTLEVMPLVQDLELADLALSVSLGSSPLMPEPAGRFMLRETLEREIVSGDMRMALRLQVAQAVLPSLIVGSMVLVLVFLVGLWTLGRVAQWARQFSAGTTERLDQLVAYCQQVVDGQSVPPVPAGPQDEITQVVQTLSAMLRQQKQTSDELRTTSLVFATAAEGIMVTDAHGCIAEVNPALLRMTGYTREQLIGRPAGALYRIAGRDDGDREIARALELLGRWSGETAFMDVRGRAIPTSVSVSRIPGDDGHSIGHVAVITDVGRLKEAEHRLRELAYRDALTGLPNLRWMSEQARERLADPQRSHVLLFIDLDHLKTVNDTYGHEAGDWMIRGMAEHLKQELPPGHLLCRRSGDELLALIELDPAEPRGRWTHLFGRLVSAEVALPAGPATVTCTIGAARYPQDAQDWAGLQVCADVAMNAGKQLQRGTLVWYDRAMGQKVKRQRQVHQRLAQALDQGAIGVHYQPVVDLVSGRLLALEALARWTDPELGEVRPSEFVAVAEEAQLSEPLTMHVLQTLLRDKPAIQQRFPGVALAFNVAPRVLRDTRLIDFLGDLAADDPDALSGLEMELTESEIASSEDQLLRQLKVLTSMGLGVVIDDFGKGYSSLTRLAQYPISCLKIDASFVSSLGQGRHTKIVELIVNLAQVLGLKVTAEGIETFEQRDLLVRMGCARGQGWLYAKALPIEQVLQLPLALRAAPARQEVLS